MTRDDEPDSDWEEAPLDWFREDLPPPTKSEHRTAYELWERAEEYRVTSPTRTVIRFSTRQRTFNPYEWEVPLSPREYRLEQDGDIRVLTFLPQQLEIYRGPGTVKIVELPSF